MAEAGYFKICRLSLIFSNSNRLMFLTYGNTDEYIYNKAPSSSPERNVQSVIKDNKQKNELSVLYPVVVYCGAKIMR